MSVFFKIHPTCWFSDDCIAVSVERIRPVDGGDIGGVRHAEASVFVGFKSLYSKVLHNLKSFLYCQSRCVILPERTRDFV